MRKNSFVRYSMGNEIDMLRCKLAYFIQHLIKLLKVRKYCMNNSLQMKISFHVINCRMEFGKTFKRLKFLSVVRSIDR